MYATPPRRLRRRAIVTILGLIASMAYTAGATMLVYVHRPLSGSVDITASMVTTLFAGIAFMVWLYRARVNLDALGVVGLRWRPGWSITGWLVPLVNLVVPLRVVSEVDRASRVRAAAIGHGQVQATAVGRGRERAAAVGPGRVGAPAVGPGRVGAPAVGSGRQSGRAVVVLWAIAWLGYVLVGLALDYPLSTGPLTILSAVLLVAAGVFAIVLVRRITAYQDAAMTMPPPAQPVLVGPPPLRPPAALPSAAPSAQVPPGRVPSGQQPPRRVPSGQQPPGQVPAGQQPSGQQPSAQAPPDAPPPTGPAVDPWPGAGY